ncbi:MAG: hypothetical protein ACRD0F_03655 [Acidimicrobiales bacterium]
MAAPQRTTAPIATLPTPVTAPARRRPRARLFAAIGLVAGSALMASNLYQRANAFTPVLALARPVTYGSVLTEADIEVVRFQGAGVSTIPADERPNVVGRWVRATLDRGTLLQSGFLASGPVLGPGQAIASVPVQAGFLPPAVRPGHRVRVVKRAAGASSDPEVVANAVVLSLTTSRDGAASTSVSLIVDGKDANKVAAAGLEGAVSLVLLGDG